MDMSFWAHFKADFFNFLTTAGIKIIYLAVVLTVGVVVIRLLMSLIKKVMRKANVELSLQSFLLSLSTISLYGILFFLAGITLGIQASAFFTAIGAIGIAVGLALQGSLSNFAGGVLILLFKPFKVGDEVMIEDKVGIVAKIDILYTRLRTYDGRLITLPNGKVSNNKVENNSHLPDRRVEIELHVPFQENFEELRKIITEAMAQHPKIIKDKPVQLWLNEFGEYYMKLSARCWATSSEFWDVYWDQIEVVKKTLDRHQIPLAIPERSIRTVAK